MDDFPDDWKYYTLTYPVARYKYLSLDQSIREMTECNGTFYSTSNILSRLGGNLLAGRNPLLGLVSNLTSRRNSMLFNRVYEALWQAEPDVDEVEPTNTPQRDIISTWEAATRQLRHLGATLKMQVAWLFRQS